MPCHRCPDDDQTKCFYCHPDPEIRKMMAEKHSDDEHDKRVAEFEKKARKNGYVHSSILCDAVEILERHGLMDEMPACVKNAYEDHRKRENKS